MNENTEEYKYELDTWEGGTLVTPAKVDLTTGIVTPAVYSGNTPITPERLEIMNQGIKKLYEEGAISKDIYIGSEEEAPEEAKIIIDSNQMQTKASEVVNSLEGNETDKAPCVQAVNNEFERVKGQILWTNSNPTSGISANTTISLSSSDYDVLEIIWKRTSTQNVIYSYRTLKGSTVEMFCNSTQGDNAPWVRSRVLSYVDDTTFTADVGYLQFCNSTSRTKETSGCIPLYIIGYKTGLFSEEVSS